MVQKPEGLPPSPRSRAGDCFSRRAGSNASTSLPPGTGRRSGLVQPNHVLLSRRQLPFRIGSQSIIDASFREFSRYEGRRKKKKPKGRHATDISPGPRQRKLIKAKGLWLGSAAARRRISGSRRASVQTHMSTSKPLGLSRRPSHPTPVRGVAECNNHSRAPAASRRQLANFNNDKFIRLNFLRFNRT